jgi:hypothetical protein
MYMVQYHDIVYHKLVTFHNQKIGITVWLLMNRELQEEQ